MEEHCDCFLAAVKGKNVCVFILVHQRLLATREEHKTSLFHRHCISADDDVV